MTAPRVDLLRDGLLRAPESEAPVVPPAAPPPAEPCGFCPEPAAARCLQCARATCAAHRWVMYGLCRECLAPDAVRRPAATEAPRPDLGIKWVED